MRGGCWRGPTSLLSVATTTNLPGPVRMGTQTGAWHLAMGQGQNVADAAATVGMLRPPTERSPPPSAPRPHRRTSGSGGITVTINRPPGSDHHQGKPGCVKAVVAWTVGDTMTFSGNCSAALLGCVATGSTVSPFQPIAMVG